MRKRNGLWGFVLLLLVVCVAVWGYAALREGMIQISPTEVSAQAGSAAESKTPRTEKPTTLPEAPPPTEAGRVRHYYHQLSTEERKAYRDIYSQLPAFPESIEVSGLNSEAMGRVFQALMFDQPLLFQISSTHYKTATLQGEIIGFLPEYRLTPEVYKYQLEDLMTTARAYLALVQGDEYEAELALHDQLTRSCKYTEDIDNPVHNTAYGALVGNQAACEGYSKAMLMLLEMRGIDAYIVTGNAVNAAGAGGGHAWNKAKIDGRWYHLDSTWDAPVVEQSDARYVSHAFFNLSDAEISASHELTDPLNPCTATEANYFVREGLFFSSLGRGDDAAVTQQLVKSINAGNGCLELRFSDDEVMQKGWKYLFEQPEQRIYRMLSNANSELIYPVNSESIYRSEMKALRLIRVFPVKK